MRSNLTTVGMYNSNISYLAAPIIISLKYRYPPLARVSAISHFWYAQGTNKLCVALEYRIVTSDILLHLSVSLKIVPVTPKERCQDCTCFVGTSRQNFAMPLNIGVNSFLAQEWKKRKKQQHVYHFD